MDNELRGLCDQQAEIPSLRVTQHVKVRNQCIARTSQGTRCKRDPRPGRSFCATHDPQFLRSVGGDPAQISASEAMSGPPDKNHISWLVDLRNPDNRMRLDSNEGITDALERIFNLACAGLLHKDLVAELNKTCETARRLLAKNTRANPAENKSEAPEDQPESSPFMDDEDDDEYVDFEWKASA